MKPRHFRRRQSPRASRIALARKAMTKKASIRSLSSMGRSLSAAGSGCARPSRGTLSTLGWQTMWGAAAQRDSHHVSTARPCSSKRRHWGSVPRDSRAAWPAGSAARTADPCLPRRGTTATPTRRCGSTGGGDLQHRRRSDCGRPAVHRGQRRGRGGATDLRAAAREQGISKSGKTKIEKPVETGPIWNDSVPMLLPARGPRGRHILLFS